MSSPAPASAVHRVVVIGGGFGGLYAARQLARDKRVELTLVDRRNFHLFQPLLYQVATGSLGPSEIAQPLRAIFRRRRNTQVVLGMAVSLDAVAREVGLSDGGTVPYDSLIVATGARFSYFAMTGGQSSLPASRLSTTRPRSGGASSSPSRRPSARRTPSGAQSG